MPHSIPSLGGIVFVMLFVDRDGLCTGYLYCVHRCAICIGNAEDGHVKVCALARYSRECLCYRYSEPIWISETSVENR
ncbi:hypothetical protein Lgee_0854 [Legionella geestiana]|uniref:Uncharacterized protein n=1 Tax=Legionella geestiana TaxID=45065 RepID=A0A0W0U0D0_9GAMM|nr:hypothetical protein Lgee_0854 [Legionella geestiana]STX52936.1 Uncharacterised protein [Legionella geestiana]